MKGYTDGAVFFATGLSLGSLLAAYNTLATAFIVTCSALIAGRRVWLIFFAPHDHPHKPKPKS